MVTGSGFDIIQTAVMKVHRDDLKVLEVCVSSISFSLIFWHLPLCLSLSLFIIHL